MTPFALSPTVGIYHVQLHDANVKWVFAESWLAARCGAAQAWGDNVKDMRLLQGRTREQDMKTLTFHQPPITPGDLRMGDFSIDLVVLP